MLPTGENKDFQILELCYYQQRADNTSLLSHFQFRLTLFSLLAETHSPPSVATFE